MPTAPPPLVAPKSETLKDLKWAVPAQDVGEKVGLDEFLIALQLLATDSDRQKAVNLGWRGKTPASMQSIKSGATGLTRWWASAVATGGGITGLVGGVSALLAGAATEVGDAVLVALIGGSALVLAATALALALFVKGDLEARGTAAAARHAGRAEVAAMFLRATTGIPKADAGKMLSTSDTLLQNLLQAMAAFPNNMQAKTTHNPNWTLVTGVRTHPTYRAQIGFQGGEWVAIDEVRDYRNKP